MHPDEDEVEVEAEADDAAVADDEVEVYDPPSAREIEAEHRGNWFNLPPSQWGFARLDEAIRARAARPVAPSIAPSAAVVRRSFLTTARPSSHREDEDDDPNDDEELGHEELGHEELGHEELGHEDDLPCDDRAEDGDLDEEPLELLPERLGRPDEVRVSERQWNSLLTRAGRSGRAVLRALVERSEPCTAVELAHDCGLACDRVLVQLRNLRAHTSALEIPEGAVVATDRRALVEVFRAGPLLVRCARTVLGRTG